MTQGLLDLKRLYWNCRAFREGKRRGRCPYEHLGLKLPSYRFWDLLWMPTSPAGERSDPKSVKFQTYGLGRSPIRARASPIRVTTSTRSLLQGGQDADPVLTHRCHPAKGNPEPEWGPRGGRAGLDAARARGKKGRSTSEAGREEEGPLHKPYKRLLVYYAGWAGCHS